jgi:sugar (pentulose or hexulose) kinase
MVRIEKVLEPNPAHRAVYDDLYGRYLAAYPALRELMHQSAAVGG